jgi:ABC-2 type transport system ATP-binding protein
MHDDQFGRVPRRAATHGDLSADAGDVVRPPGFGYCPQIPVVYERLTCGTRSKLNLAIALLHDPALVLLDEPYAGFDWDTYQRFWTLTAERRNAGAGLLIISHFIADEERFDRIYDLVDGRAVER